MSDPGPLVPVVLPLTGKTIFSNEAISGLITAEIGAAIAAGKWPPPGGSAYPGVDGTTLDALGAGGTLEVISGLYQAASTVLTALATVMSATATAAAQRTALGLGTAATQASTAFDAAGAAAAAQAASQAASSVLTALATVMSATATAAAQRTALGLGTAATHAATDFSTSTRSIGFAFDGGGSALTAGKQATVYVPYACTITGVTVLADQSGSAVVDLWLAPYGSYPPNVGNTIVASAPPTISAAAKNQDNTLTGWSTSVAAGSTLIAHINSASTVTQLSVVLAVTG